MKFCGDYRNDGEIGQVAEKAMAERIEDKKEEAIVEGM